MMGLCSPRSRTALLVAALALSPSRGWARDTAGPDPQPAPRATSRPPASSAPAAPPAATVAAQPQSSTPAAAPAAAPAASPAAPHASSASPAAAPAGPQPTPDAADAERAKQLYASGAEAFAAQRNADAIGYFRRAAELVPSAKLTYNIGLAYEEMGDTGRALAEYRSYLEQEAESDPERRDDVKTRIAYLEQRLAAMGVQQLRIESEPAGATVRIAGRARGITPWSGELVPGEHVVELDLPGHTPGRARVLVPADRSAELTLALAPSPPVEAEPALSRWANVSPLTWTFLGVGAAALVGGVGFELSRASSSDRERDATDPTARAEARGAADAKQMASLILFGFGAGFTIGGSVLLALDLSEERSGGARTGDARSGDARSGDARPGRRDQTALSLPCGPAFCGVMTQGRF